MRFDRKILTPFLVCAAAISLTACASTAQNGGTMARVDGAMQHTAAQDEGRSEESMAVLEQAYKRNSTDAEAAFNYARGLRHNGYYNRADMVLKPFASAEKVKNADVLIEYSSILSAMGNYLDAESYARKAVLMDPDSGQAYHVLGIALDAQGLHPQAQVAFEKGLERWKGDPSPILNNMGLNLAAQGFLDQAIETLRKALDTAPNRMEIERNLRIVSALQYQPPKEGMRLIPKPQRKPKISTNTPGPDAQPSEKTQDAVPVEPVDREETGD